MSNHQTHVFWWYEPSSVNWNYLSSREIPHSVLRSIPWLSRISCVLIVWHVCNVTPQVSCPPARLTDCRGFLDPLLSGDISCWYRLLTGHRMTHIHPHHAFAPISSDTRPEMITVVFGLDLFSVSCQQNTFQFYLCHCLQEKNHF